MIYNFFKNGKFVVGVICKDKNQAEEYIRILRDGSYSMWVARRVRVRTGKK